MSSFRYCSDFEMLMNKLFVFGYQQLLDLKNYYDHKIDQQIRLVLKTKPIFILFR